MAALLAWRASIPVGSFIVVSELSETQLQQLADDYLNRPDIESIYPALDVFRLRTQSFPSSVASVLNDWIADGAIQTWQSDGMVNFRNSPNDDLYPDQWGMQITGMEEAWEFTTGGLTLDGDTIVIAVLDYGYDLDHPDLRSNIWVNHNEIPDDMIDNDDNGYVDDHYGYSTENGGDNHSRDNHGNGVLGIIGAIGNNSEGVAGSNWQVKMLTVSGIERESDVIEGYGYIRQVRQDYNTSGGQKGAFVVVSNFSAGIDGAFPEDHQVWCSLYDDLGELGILNVTSATNRESDVDIEGDIPSTCQSQFLLTVTNVNRNDEKDIPAGFGQENIDLGAPGSQTITTDINGDYFEFGGTSAAAPHVAGLIGLLYSSPCDEVSSLAITNPVLAALRMRSAILNNVTRLSSLDGRTVSGGRINAADAAKRVCTEFGGLPADKLEITSVSPNPSNGRFALEFVTDRIEEHQLRVFDATGREIYKERFLPSAISNVKSVDLATGITGIYYLELSRDSMKDVFTIVVQ